MVPCTDPSCLQEIDNREVGTQPQPRTEIGKIKDVLLRAFENEKRVLRKSVSKMDSVVSLLRSEVENITEVLAQTEEASRYFKRHVTSEMKQMKEENDVLMDKYT